MRTLLPIGVLVAAFSGYRWWSESQSIAAAQPVAATVLDSRVEEWTSGTGMNRERNYRPVVRFRYEFAGETRESDLVTPLGDSGTGAWAHELANRFPKDAEVEAWVDPASPDGAFLVKMTSWKPRVGLPVGAIIALLCGVGLWRARQKQTA